MSLSLRPSDVIWWADFPLGNYGGKLKPRWLIALGRTSVVDPDEIWFFCTTTTTLRQDILDANDGMKLEPPPFTETCYLYFREEIIPISKHTLDSYAQKISPKGNISNEDFKMIYLGYKVTNTQAPKTLKFIKHSTDQYELGIQLP